MEYKIIEIAPVEGDDDVLVTVAYWYNDFVSWTGKKPDFIEHHLIGPVPRQQPIRNRVGQFMGKDNVWITPWVLSDDETEWVYQEPDMALVQHEDVNVDEFVLRPIDSRAQAVKEQQPRGADFFRQGDLKVNQRARSLARDQRVRKHLDKTRRL